MFPSAKTSRYLVGVDLEPGRTSTNQRDLMSCWMTRREFSTPAPTATWRSEAVTTPVVLDAMHHR